MVGESADRNSQTGSTVVRSTGAAVAMRAAKTVWHTGHESSSCGGSTGAEPAGSASVAAVRFEQCPQQREDTQLRSAASEKALKVWASSCECWHPRCSTCVAGRKSAAAMQSGRRRPCGIVRAFWTSERIRKRLRVRPVSQCYATLDVFRKSFPQILSAFLNYADPFGCKTVCRRTETSGRNLFFERFIDHEFTCCVSSIRLATATEFPIT